VEAEILQDMITYLGDEVSEADNPVLLILINELSERFVRNDIRGDTRIKKKRRQWNVIGIRYLKLPFITGQSRGLTARIAIRRMESAGATRARTTFILMLCPWRKFFNIRRI